MVMNKGQFLTVFDKRYPPIMVELAPARLPIRFIVPATEAAYFPPTSMHDAQACGTTRSLKNAAAAMNAMVVFTSGMWAATERKTPAPRKPVQAMNFRVRAMLPVQTVTRPATNPQNREPIPLNKSGKTAYFALWVAESL